MEKLNTNKAPAAVGPYSQAVKTGDMLYTSGQIPLDPVSGEIVGSSITEQAEQVMKNMKNLLEAAGTSIDQVVKTSVFIKNMDDFATINGIYAKYFEKDCPARSCVEIARLPKDVLLEMEAIAVK